MSLSLKEAFDKTRLAGKLRFLTQNPIVITGAAQFDLMLPEIFKQAPTGNVIYEWRMKMNAPTALIIAPTYLQALLKLEDMVIKQSHLSYDGEKFRGARYGKYVLALMRNGEPKLYMVSKNKVMGLIDPLERRERDLLETAELLMNMAQEKGIPQDKIRDLIMHFQDYKEPPDSTP